MNTATLRRKAIFVQSIFFATAAVLILTSIALVLFIGSQGLRLFTTYSPADFFFGTSWNQSTHTYGVIPLLYGSLMTTFLTLLVSVPLAILVAIFMVEVAPAPMRRVMRSTVELFAALPSVIFGLLALTIIVPWVRETFNAPLGKGILPATIVLIFMVQPTIVTITEDAVRTSASSLREACHAVGATRWQMLSGVIIPASRQGILTAVILGLGRAVGETMAVQMVIGNITVRIPKTLTEGATTMPATIVTQLPEAADPQTRSALIMVGFLLLIIAFALILSVRTVTGRSSKKPKAVKAEAPEPVSPDPRDPLRELEREMEAS
ncbi:MAG: phosphate ABC transporter permease subunit PstC [Caldilineae bacterium]|nr:phosphate ABC transporter permease subunit PstC [Anaerolineae bacterium]MCB0204096.1 phosphate ABC transporter permease subunit PstC [Anaerolineae bacterium]MCB9140601.1 phosphate ABC transporter permease subunit PstC [Caldilineaceae bacterium]MCB9153042.1 phosphate ABC transporter permease subunit PstC [Caldilineae bacterium]